MSERELSRRITEALSSLRRRVGIADALAARGVSETDIPQLTRHAINDACLVTNPRRVVVGDLKAIYGEAL